MTKHLKKPALAVSLLVCGMIACAGTARAQDYSGVLAPDDNAQSPRSGGPPVRQGFNFNGQDMETGSYGDSAAVGPYGGGDVSGGSSDGMQDSGQTADVGPSQDDTGGDFSAMYGTGDSDSSNLYDFVNNESGDSDKAENKREAAIVKAAVDKQRQIQAANIARRKANEAIVKNAAKAAQQQGQQGDDGDSYSSDGGDDGYYGPSQVEDPAPAD